MLLRVQEHTKQEVKRFLCFHHGKDMGYLHPQKDGGSLPVIKNGHQGIDRQRILDLAHESDNGHLFLRVGGRVKSIKQKLPLDQIQVFLLAQTIQPGQASLEIRRLALLQQVTIETIVLSHGWSPFSSPHAPSSKQICALIVPYVNPSILLAGSVYYLDPKNSSRTF